jgi:hypothetical protein
MEGHDGKHSSYDVAEYALRFTFGISWLIDAVLKWLPGFRPGHLQR